MNPNPNPNLLPVGPFCVRLFKGRLNLDRTPDRVQRAWELHKKSIPDRINFSPLMLCQITPNKLSLFLEELHGKGFIPLGERGIPHHIGEHERSESSLAFDLGWIVHLDPFNFHQ